MSDPNLFRLRITFCKQGRLSLLSHLEIARALERAIRRARLPFAVSQGFSPHMRIAFGAALPVGVGGTDEMVDLLLTRYVNPDEALLALQQASVADLMVKACDYVDSRTPAASAQFPLGTYEAILNDSPKILVIPAQITVVRKRKEKVLNVSEFLVGDVNLNGPLVTFTLESKLTGSLRPDVFMKKCCTLTDKFFAGQLETDDAKVGNASQADCECSALLLVQNEGVNSCSPELCEPLEEREGAGSVDSEVKTPLRVCSMMRIAQRPLGSSLCD